MNRFKVGDKVIRVTRSVGTDVKQYTQYRSIYKIIQVYSDGTVKLSETNSIAEDNNFELLYIYHSPLYKALQEEDCDR